MENPKNILLFSPHPDDHICVAGTLMFLKDRSFEIHEVVATKGEQGAWWISDKEKKKDFEKKELQNVRKKEIGKASRIIGISKTTFLGLPDCEIAWDFKTIDRIVKTIREDRPQIVFLPNYRDYHSDHRIMSQMVKEAVERSSWNNRLDLGASWKVPLVLYFEGFYLGKPHVLVDITSYLEKKKKVVDVYASQIYPSERRLLESINAYRGFFTRDHHALAGEGFEIPEEFPVCFNRIVEIFGNGGLFGNSS